MTQRKVGHGMGRKPVDQVQAAQQCDNPQEAVWQAIRALKRFTRGDISRYLVKAGMTGVNDSTVRSYTERLVRGGYIELVTREPYKGAATLFTYALVNDAGRDAPRLRSDGSASGQGLGNEHLWRSMKVLGEFDYRELVATATTEAVVIQPATAKKYLRYLNRAGYLVMTVDAALGKPARYRLLPSRNTGPRPPQVQRTHRIYDPNLRKIMWSESDE